MADNTKTVRRGPQVRTRPLGELKNELNEDPEFRAAMAELEPWEQITRALIRYRIERDLTQTELAKLAGISQPAVARLEAAEHEPRLSTLRKVVHALGGELVIDLRVGEERRRLTVI
jgi:DNA-binding XRE family transcriptional regulator